MICLLPKFMANWHNTIAIQPVPSWLDVVNSVSGKSIWGKSLYHSERKVKHVLSRFSFSLFGIIVRANRQRCHDGSRGQMSPMAEKLSESVVFDMNGITDHYFNVQPTFYILDTCTWEDWWQPGYWGRPPLPPRLSSPPLHHEMSGQDWKDN